MQKILIVTDSKLAAKTKENFEEHLGDVNKLRVSFQFIQYPFEFNNSTTELTQELVDLLNLDIVFQMIYAFALKPSEVL